MMEISADFVYIVLSLRVNGLWVALLPIRYLLFPSLLSSALFPYYIPKGQLLRQEKKNSLFSLCRVQPLLDFYSFLLSPFSSSFLLFIGTLSPAVCRDIENSPSEDNQLFKSNSHDEEQKAFRQNKHIDRDTEFRGLKAVA